MLRFGPFGTSLRSVPFDSMRLDARSTQNERPLSNRGLGNDRYEPRSGIAIDALGYTQTGLSDAGRTWDFVDLVRPRHRCFLEILSRTLSQGMRQLWVWPPSLEWHTSI